MRRVATALLFVVGLHAFPRLPGSSRRLRSGGFGSFLSAKEERLPRERVSVQDAIEAVHSGNELLALRIFSGAVQHPLTTVKECNKFIRVLADSGGFESARVAYERMLTSPMRPNVVTLSTIISRAARQDLRLAIDLFEEFSRQGIEPDVVAYNTLVHALAKTGRMTEAFETLGTMKHGGVNPNIVTYNSLIGGSAKLKMELRVRELLRTMKLQGMRANSRTYNSIIAAYAKHGDLDSALKYFDGMRADDVAADLFTYSSLIDCAVKTQDFKTAYRLLRDLKEDGLTPNVVVWTTLIDGCGKAGRLDAAHALFKQMIATGTKPNVVTCSALIDAAWKHGKNKMAVEMLEFMKREGLKPTQFIWTSLFVNSAATGDLRPLTVLRNMTSEVMEEFTGSQEGEAGINSRMSTSDSKLFGYLKAGISSETHPPRDGDLSHGESDAAQTAEDVPLHPNYAKTDMSESRGSCIDRIRAIGSTADLDVVSSELYHDLRASPSKVDRKALRELLKACGRTGTSVGLLRAIMILYEMAERKETSIREGDFLALMEGCRAAGNSDGVVDAFNIMRGFAKRHELAYPSDNTHLPSTLHGVTRNYSGVRQSGLVGVKSYTEVLQAVQRLDTQITSAPSVGDYGQVGLPASAPTIVTNVQPSETDARMTLGKFGTPSRRSRHQDNLYKVFLVFRQMQYEGIHGDIYAYNGLLSACANAGEPLRAVDIFAEMMERGVQPDSISYTMLIKAYHLAGDADGAENVFEEMQSPTHHFKEFCRPTEAAYAHLLGALLRNGRHERMYDLYEQMRHFAGLRPSFLSVKFTLTACQKEGWQSRAIDVFTDAQNVGLPMQGPVGGNESENDPIVWVKNLYRGVKARAKLRSKKPTND